MRPFQRSEKQDRNQRNLKEKTGRNQTSASLWSLSLSFWGNYFKEKEWR